MAAAARRRGGGPTPQRASLLNAAGYNDLRPFNLEREFCGISQGVVIQLGSFSVPASQPTE